MGRVNVEVTSKKEMHYLPCIKCKGENVDFVNPRYSSFNVAWCKCRDCGNEVKNLPCDGNDSIERLIEIWNKANDPVLLRRHYVEQIKELQRLIDELPY